MDKTKVLIVEDNPADVRLLQERFKRYANGEFEQFYESNLEGALKRLASEKMDLILLDLFLPETVGLETLSWIRKADPETSIIVLTGMDDEQIAAQALERGAEVYFVKDDVDEQEFIEALRSSAENSSDGTLSVTLHDGVLTMESPEGERARGKVPRAGAKPKPGSLAESGPKDLAEILEKERVEVHFQPWVSIKQQLIVGMEGLCRGKGEFLESLISPASLRKQAVSQGLLSDLDHLFCRKVFEAFKPIAQQNPDLILSVNFDMSVLNQSGNDFNNFLFLAHEHGLDPGHIAIEILDSPDCDTDLLKRFIESQRSLGFLIALDDVGFSPSSLDRVAELRPDFIKTGLPLVMDMEKSYSKKELFKSLVKLANGIGAFVIAQGAETEVEAMLALKMGATLIQGYYFSEPGKARGSLMAACREKIESVVHKYKHHLASSLHIKQSCYGEYARLLYGIGLELASISPLDFEDKLTGISQRHPHLECLFMLDQEGKQVGHRVSNRYHMPHGKMIFSAMKPGADHSMYEYYYCLLENHLKEFTFFSKPYLSQSTGKLCITVSTLFKNADGDRYILCVEVKPEHLLMQS